jgi:hypothetical protein
MNKLKKQVTLTQSTIKTLTTLGLGSLSTGIELLTRGHVPTSTPEHADTQKIDGRIQTRLDREAREAAEAKQKAYDSPREELRQRIQHAHLVSAPHQLHRVIADHRSLFVDTIPLAESADIENQVLTEVLAKQQATPLPPTPLEITTPTTPPPPTQTLKLSLTSLRRMELLGTPEALTDAQIQELNDYYSA